METAQRVTFGEALAEIGAENERLVVLDADVSSSTQTRIFGTKFPGRFFNFGIAEANMVSAAAGFAACGYIPVVSSFALFLSLRAVEQIRAQIAYPRLNVKLIGGYAGLSDFADGASHQSVEDLAVMRAIPNMTVLAPCDAFETREALRAAIAHDGPVFIRISREAVPELLGPPRAFALGAGCVLRDGTDVTLVGTGLGVRLALQAAEKLGQAGISAQVIDIHTLKPLDRDLILSAARKTGAIVTVEEHSVIGGLGGAVCEALCELHPVPISRVGIPDQFGESGTYSQILKRAGVDVEHVTQAVAAVPSKKLQANHHER